MDILPKANEKEDENSKWKRKRKKKQEKYCREKSPSYALWWIHVIIYSNERMRVKVHTSYTCIGFIVSFFFFYYYFLLFFLFNVCHRLTVWNFQLCTLTYLVNWFIPCYENAYRCMLDDFPVRRNRKRTKKKKNHKQRKQASQYILNRNERNNSPSN